MSFLTQSHEVFLGHPLCLIPSTSNITQGLTYLLVSSLRSTHPNHLNLLFLISKMTHSYLNGSLSSSLFFLSFSLIPHIQLIILISMQFNFTSCSALIGQVSLPNIRQLLAYTWPFFRTPYIAMSIQRRLRKLAHYGPNLGLWL